MAEPFTSRKWGIFVQPGGPNTTLHYLGCQTLGDVEEPGGGISSLISYFRADGGGWNSIGEYYEQPGPITTSLTGLVQVSASWLERIIESGRCPFPLYINGKVCPPHNVFAGAERWYTLEHARLGTSGLTGLANIAEDSPSEQRFDVTARPPVVRGRAVVTNSIPNSAVQILNAVTSCTGNKCAGCGDATDVCDTLVAVADSSGVASADVWISYDNGLTWAQTAADPFPALATTDLRAVQCFPINPTTTRILVARENVAATPMHVAYSDDWGANWTDVTLTSANNAGSLRYGTLYALDMYHIWLVLGTGEIFFSDDGGVTWTEQVSPTAQILDSVRFIDEHIGMIVGHNDTVLTTIDGGTTWGTATATGDGGHLISLGMTSAGHWWAGSANGNLWYSTDHGVTWTQRAFPGDGAGVVYGISFVTETVGFMIHSPTGATGRVYRTRDGGWTWELESATVAGELYGLYACDVNHAFAVGEPAPTNALILKVHD